MGIDSIKKAQLFGELREFFDLESLTTFSLDSFKSLRDIVALLLTVPGKGDWLLQTTQGSASTTTIEPTAIVTNEVTAIAETPAPAAVVATDSDRQSKPASTFDHGQLEQILIDFVVEQTGYPPEIVELDADLEAD